MFTSLQMFYGFILFGNYWQTCSRVGFYWAKAGRLWSIWIQEMVKWNRVNGRMAAGHGKWPGTVIEGSYVH